MMYNLAIVMSAVLLVVFLVMAVAAVLENKALRENKAPYKWVSSVNDFVARYPYLYGG